MASIATWMSMAIRNLSSHQYSWNDLDRVLFSTVAIFLKITIIDRSCRPVDSRKSFMQVRCCIRAVLYIKAMHANLLYGSIALFFSVLATVYSQMHIATNWNTTSISHCPASGYYNYSCLNVVMVMVEPQKYKTKE